MTEILIRFLIGGLTVSFFAILGDLLNPKSFAGLFGAAPSVALATVFLTLTKEGPSFVATEALSMIAGAFAFFVYAWISSRLLVRGKMSALAVTISALSIWFAGAFGLWFVFLK